jgi:hypothetical protein
LVLIFIYIKKRKKKAKGRDEHTVYMSGFKVTSVGGLEDNYKSQSKPIQLTIVSTSDKAEKVVLFNRNRNICKDNYGNSDKIKITCSNEHQDYGQILNQIAEKKIKTSLIRIQSVNTAQITEILGLSSSDANGAAVYVPLITQSYFSANQFQSGILDIPVSVVIDGNFEMSVATYANTTWFISIFPSEVGDLDMNSIESLIEFSGLMSKRSKFFTNVPVAAMPLYVNPFSSDKIPSKLKTWWNKIVSKFKKKGDFKMGA